MIVALSALALITLSSLAWLRQLEQRIAYMERQQRVQVVRRAAEEATR